MKKIEIAVIWMSLLSGCMATAEERAPFEPPGVEIEVEGRVLAAAVGTHVPAPGVEVTSTAVLAPTREVVVADPPSTPLYGGSLVISRDETRAVAADPDRDLVWLVDLVGREVLRTFTLEEGAEPWRIVEDDQGRFHVTLRRAGDVLTFTRGGEPIRRPICAAPRGVAAAAESIHVACAEGVLVTLPASGGPPTRRLTLDTDLRDVVIDAQDESVLYVSRFRSAEVLVLSPDGVVTERLRPPGRGQVLPGVAYRMRSRSVGGVWLLHQRAVIGAEPGAATPVYYGGVDCTSNNVLTVISYLRPGRVPLLYGAIGETSLGVDFTIESGHFYVVAPGSRSLDGDDVRGAQVRVVPFSYVESDVPTASSCHLAGWLRELEVDGPITAAAAGRGWPWFLSREPAVLVRKHRVWIELPGPSRRDDGFDLFHRRPGEFQITCAGCHPEGGEDGFVWNFGSAGAPVLRRTQTLHGGVSGTEPLHWAGDMVDFESLVHGTMSRMGARVDDPRLVDALRHFLDGVRHLPVPAPADPALAARGREVFASAEAQCADCHSGSRLSNDATVDVGTGGAFQVPTLLGLRHRAPYLHDGRAATIRGVLTDAYTDGHGSVSHLAPADLDALVAYLESL